MVKIKWTAQQQKDIVVTAGALGFATLALSFGVTESINIAAPLGVIAGMTGAVIVASPWKSRIANKLRTGPALPIFDKSHKQQPALTFEQTTPMIEERDTMIRPAQRSQPLQRKLDASTAIAPAPHIKHLILQEASVINRTLQANNIRAKASAATAVNVEVGFIRYPLQIHPGEKFAKVEAIIRELSSALTRNRQRVGLSGNLPIVPVSDHGLALEVPHPSPVPLPWSPRMIATTPPHTMLIGRSYLDKPRYEYVKFDDSPHVLIAGITGAGKSVLLQTMLLSLCAGTSPDELQLVLVDLKNEDLVPFENLPHTRIFAGRQSEAIDAIRFVYDEKEKRIANRGYKPYRLVLVIDEMAQLAGIKEAGDMLGNLASIGRSKGINLIGATQQPTDKGGLGTLLKANFPIRLVGMVAPGQSYTATGRPQTHADLLPGKGAFLRCEGPDVFRFQSFFIDEKNGGEVSGFADYIAKDIWQVASYKAQNQVAMGGYEPDIAPYIANYSQLPASYHTSKTAPPAVASYENLFPIAEGRALSTREAIAVRELASGGGFDYRGKLSMNRAMEHVYGSRSPERSAWISEALNAVSDDKIIKLRKIG